MPVHVVIVSNDSALRHQMSNALQCIGCDVTSSENGVGALKIMRKNMAPEIMIVEQMRTGDKPWEIVHKIRALQNGSEPFIIMLADKQANTADFENGLEAGGDDFIKKPFDLGELKTRVSVACRFLFYKKLMEKESRVLHKALDRIETLKGFLLLGLMNEQVRGDMKFWEMADSLVSDSPEDFG